MFPRYARLMLAAATAGAALASSALADTQLIGHIAPAQPVGWSDLVVPAIAPGSIGTQPLTTPLELLPGQSLYFNWAVGHNAAINGTWVDALLVDGVLVAAHPRHNPVFAGKTWFALDDGPYALSGGRHTLTVHSDLYAQTNEESLDRGDNVQSVSYVWRPEALLAGTTATTFAPPEAGSGPQPNGYAFSFVPAGVDPFGIAVLSPSGDLVVYDDYVDAKHGLTHVVASSASPGDSIDLVVGGPPAAGGALYPAIVASPTGPPAPLSAPRILWDGPNGRSLGDPTTTSDVTLLPAGTAFHLWLVWLTPGSPVPIELEHFSGLPTPPAEIALFPPADGALRSLHGALAVSTRTPGTDRSPILVSPSAAGWYVLAVHRPVLADGGDFYYRLRMGPDVVAVGDPPPPGTLALRATPVPATTGARFEFALPQNARARLALYDVLGRTRRVLFDGDLAAGTHAITWDLRDGEGGRVAAGVYWARLEVGSERATSRLVVGAPPSP